VGYLMGVGYNKTLSYTVNKACMIVVTKRVHTTMGIDVAINNSTRELHKEETGVLP